MKRIFHLFGVLAILFALESHADPTTIPTRLSQYIIPDNHNGPLIMVLRNGDGLKLPAPPATWTFEFPQNGIIIVDWDTYLLPPPHKPPKDYIPITKARYSNGTPLPLAADANDDQVAFRGVYGVGKDIESGITSTGAVYYFVGTRPEADEFKRQQELKFRKTEQGAAANP